MSQTLDYFLASQNDWGVYGMNMVGRNGGDGPAGLNSFLQGFDNQTLRLW